MDGCDYKPIYIPIIMFINNKDSAFIKNITIISVDNLLAIYYALNIFV